MNMEHDRYSKVFIQITDWGHNLYLSGGKIALGDKEYDKQAFADCSKDTVTIFPYITQAVSQIVQRVEFVSMSDLAGSYPHSPYATLHVSLQKLERLLITDTLIRSENFKNLPHNLIRAITPALAQIRTLDEPQPPQLDQETIANLSQFHSLDIGVWEHMKDGLLMWHELLSRTLATKLKFNKSPIQGYNRRAVQLCDFELMFLDEVGKCTSWQYRWDRRGYANRIKSLTFGFASEKTGADRFTQSGKMWSEEMYGDIGDYLTLLQTGQKPTILT